MDLATSLQKMIDAAKNYETPDFSLEIGRYRVGVDEFIILSMTKQKDAFSYDIEGTYFTGYTGKTKKLNPEETAQLLLYPREAASSLESSVLESFKEVFSQYIAQACKNVIRKKLDDLMR